MDLEADELPLTNNHAFNLIRIGFVPYRSFPCIPLLWKTLFTLTFCFTLRQQNHSIDVSIFRGSKLIADRMRELKSIHEQQEKEMLMKIKQKVEQIRISQQKIERNVITAKTHSDGIIHGFVNNNDINSANT